MTKTTMLHPDITQLLQARALSAIMSGGEDVVDIHTMTRKTLLEALTAKIAPYTRGGNIITFIPSKGRFKIRIPSAISPTGKAVEIYDRSDIACMNKAYELLVGSPEEVTMAALWGDYLEIRKADPDVATSTIERDSYLWAKHCEGQPITKRPVQELRASEIKKFYKSRTAGKAITRKELNNVKSILNGILALAVDRDIVPVNPAAAVTTKDLKCKVVHNEGQVYTRAERDALLSYLDTQEPSLYSLAISLAFCLDVRIGELKALTWADYDEQAGTIRIERQYVMRKDDLDDPQAQKHAVLLDHTKSGEGGDRRLPVSPRARRYLQLARRRRPFGKLILESENGTPLRTNRFNEKLKAYCQAAGVRYFSSHKIRFFSITEQAASGMDLATIQYNSGHKSPQMTYHYMRPQGMAEDQREHWNTAFN